MENGPFIDDFPNKTSIYKGFSMAMLNNQRVNHYHISEIAMESSWKSESRSIFFYGIFMEDWLKNHLRTSQFAVENQHV
jgi:hypothetical protein